MKRKIQLATIAFSGFLIFGLKTATNWKEGLWFPYTVRAALIGDTVVGRPFGHLNSSEIITQITKKANLKRKPDWFQKRGDHELQKKGSLKTEGRFMRSKH